MMSFYTNWIWAMCWRNFLKVNIIKINLKHAITKLGASDAMQMAHYKLTIIIIIIIIIITDMITLTKYSIAFKMSGDWREWIPRKASGRKIVGKGSWGNCIWPKDNVSGWQSTILQWWSLQQAGMKIVVYSYPINLCLSYFKNRHF